MRYLLILFLSFCSLSAFSQGIYNKAATNIKQNRLMADSVLGVPRDTSATNNATFNGAPVGDSGRIAYQFGKFWGHDGTGWTLLGSQAIDTTKFIRNGTSAQAANYNITGNGTIGNTLKIATTDPLAAPLNVGTLPSYLNLSAFFEGTIQHDPATNGNEGVTLSQLVDSINSGFNFSTRMTPLASELAIPIQPTDSLTLSLGKLQAQISAIEGKYIENQDTVYQIGRFTLSGASKIRSITQRPNLTLTKGPSDTTYAILTFDDYANNRLGYIGAPSFTDPNSMTLAVLRSRMYYITRDTSSHIFGNYNGATSAFYTYMRNGHWRFYRQATNPFDHDATNYDPSYTMQVDGQLRFDTLRALNFTSASTPITSTTGKFLSVNTSGDVGLYDLRASTAWLNGSQAQYAATVDTIDVISQATNYNYRIKLRRTGGIMYDAFFIKGSNGLTGIGTVNPSSTLTVKGSVSMSHTVTSGNLTLTDAHSVVRVSNSAHAITLPGAASAYSGAEGRIYTIMNYNTGGNVTISSVQVYGSATTSIPNNTSWTIQSDGTNWILISRSN